MRLAILAVAVAGALGLVAGPANATLVVQTGNIAQNDDNVVSNGCTAPVTGPALTVKGCFNNNPNQLVDFTSNENITYTGGQATLQAVDGTLATLTIAVEDKTFTTLILNIDAIKQDPDAPSKVQFTDGITTSSLFSLSPSGQNFFTLTGGPFSFITFNIFGGQNFAVALGDVADVKQVRIGGTKIISDPNPVPEPATLALLGGIGLTGLGLLRRRRTVR